jgi:hypothetical protein
VTDVERCKRCLRLAPPWESSEYTDWEAIDDGQAVICPGCVTGQEQQAMDEDIMDLMDEVARQEEMTDGEL